MLLFIPQFSWFRIAIKEWFGQFVRQYPGVRDLLWLMFLLSFVFLFSFLIVGSKKGLSDKLVDVLLGRLDEGISIWVRPNSYEGKFEFSKKTINELEKKNLLFFSYHEVGETILELPVNARKYNAPGFKGIAISENDPIWTYAIHSSFRKNHKAAVDNTKLPSNPLKLQIILSRSMFKKYFDDNAYIDFLQQYLPKHIFSKYKFSDKREFYKQSKNSVIWLKIGNAGNKDLLPISVKWIDRFPIPGEQFWYAILKPLYYTLKTTKYDENDQNDNKPDFPLFFPESSGKEAQRIKLITILKDKVSYEKIDRFKKCLHIKKNKSDDDLKIILEPEQYLSNNWIEACATESKIFYNEAIIPSRISSDAIVYTNFNQILDSSPVEQSYVSNVNIQQEINQKNFQKFIQCTQKNKQRTQEFNHDNQQNFIFDKPFPSKEIVESCAENAKISKDQIQLSLITSDDFYFSNFNLIIPCKRKKSDEQCQDGKIFRKIDKATLSAIRAFIYVKNRDQLSDAIDQIKAIDDQSLDIVPSYSDTLRRFSVIILIFDTLQWPFIIFLVFFLVALISFMMNIIIGYRRHNYGIFLAKGIKRRHIYFIMYFQTTISTICGFFLSLLFFKGIIYLLNYKMKHIMEKYGDLFYTKINDLLLLNISDYLFILCVGLFACWMLSTLTLVFMPLYNKTMPDHLLQE